MWSRALPSASVAFALDKLRARDAAGHERLVARHFLGQLDGGRVDFFRLSAIAGAAQLFARAKKRQRLQHMRAGVEKLAMQLAERIRMLDGDLRRELAAAAAGADLLAAGAAVHIAAALQLDQVAAIANDEALFETISNGFHGASSVSSAEACGASGCDW